MLGIVVYAQSNDWNETGLAFAPRENWIVFGSAIVIALILSGNIKSIQTGAYICTAHTHISNLTSILELFAHFYRNFDKLQQLINAYTLGVDYQQMVF